jgi:hypothetical protein
VGWMPENTRGLCEVITLLFTYGTGPGIP